VLPNRIFEPLLLGTMLVMAATVFIRPSTLAPPAGAPVVSVRDRPWASLGLLGAGFYGGMLQAGVGFVLLALLGGLLRYDLVRGNALKTAIVFAYSILALVVFIVQGKVAWLPALVLTVGNVVGAWLAVHIALHRRGEQIIRIVFVVMVLCTIAVVALR
jgi:uncharacterized membrane protein YfcA